MGDWKYKEEKKWLLSTNNTIGRRLGKTDNLKKETIRKYRHLCEITLWRRWNLSLTLSLCSGGRERSGASNHFCQKSNKGL